jgi:hypothetical protein
MLSGEFPLYFIGSVCLLLYIKFKLNSCYSAHPTKRMIFINIKQTSLQTTACI